MYSHMALLHLLVLLRIALECPRGRCPRPRRPAIVLRTLLSVDLRNAKVRKEMSFKMKDGLRDIGTRGQARNTTRDSRGYRVEPLALSIPAISNHKPISDQ